MQHDLDHLGVALGVKLAAEQNVVADRAGKEPRVLLRERALHAGTLGHRAAAQVQAAQQRQHQRRLAAAGRADDGEHLAALAAQRDAAQRGGGARRHARIGERGVLELEEHVALLGLRDVKLQVVDVDAEEVLLDAAQADEAAREVDGDLRRREQRIAKHVEERNDAERDGGGEHARVERVVHRKRDRGNDDGHGEDERVGGGADARALDEAELGGGAEALNARGKVVLPGVVLGELDGGEKLGRGVGVPLGAGDSVPVGADHCSDSTSKSSGMTMMMSTPTAGSAETPMAVIASTQIATTSSTLVNA
jgi:hypothetical protein